MKKILSILISITLLIVPTTFIFASDNSPKVYLNGESILFPDAKPFIDENGRTQVPVRFISEALKAGVDWKAETKTITIKLDSDTIILSINKKEYILNGKVNYMDTACLLKDDRTFVPLRFVSEALGAVVSWDGSTNSVKIAKTVSGETNNTSSNPNTSNMPNTSNPSNTTKIPGIVSIGDRTYLVDNNYVNFTGFNPDEMSERHNGILLIPIKKLAEIFNGEYTYLSDNKKAVLIIDGSKFEFDSSSNIAKVNGVNVQMSCKPSFKSGVVKVPASVFINNLNNYEVKMFNEQALLMRNKSMYNEKGDYIGSNANFQFTSYIDRLKKSQWDTPEQTTEMIKKIDKISDEIVSKISYDGMTDYEKVLAVNKYMIENVEYDLAYTSKYWDAFLSKKAVCSGFTYATGLLLEKMGVKSIDVVGYGGVEGYEDYDKFVLLNYETNAHEWNIVYIDGKYYHLDTTFNHGLSNKADKKTYDYLLISDEQISNDHSWRKGMYPKCENYYNESTISKLDVKGFPVIQGEIKLGKEVKDTYVKVEAYSVSKTMLYSKKIIHVTADKPSKFVMMFDKDFKQDDIKVEFSVLKNKLGGGFYEEGIMSKITINEKESFYNVLIEPQNSNSPTKYTWKMKVPSGVTVDIAYSFIMDIMYYNSENNEYKGHKFIEGSLLPNNNTIEFEEVLPMEFVNYSIEYSFNTVYLGKNEAILPFIKKGFVDGNGNYSENEVIINGKEHPFDKVIINLAKNENQEVVEDGRMSLNDDNIKTLKEQLIVFNCGNHEVMKSLLVNDDIIKLEGKQPRDIDNNGNYYYDFKLPNGIEIFRSYNLEQKNYSLFYSVNINNVKITKDNFIEVMQILNEFLREQLKEDKLKEPALYLYENDSTSKDLRAPGVFEKLSNAEAQLEVSYTKEKFTYLLTLDGVGHGDLGIGFHVIKKK